MIKALIKEDLKKLKNNIKIKWLFYFWYDNGG